MAKDRLSQLQVETIRENIDSIEQLVQDVKKKQSDILSNPGNDKQLKQELDELMGTIKKKTNQTRSMLKTIEKQVADEEAADNANAEVRIRKTQLNTLTRKFMDIMTDYSKAQADYRDRCNEKMTRQITIANPDMDPNQVSEMIEEGETSALLQGIVTDAEQGKQMLADIEARHADILKLETSIKELHEMFMDMAMLVESQGEMVDRIEFNVEQSKEYVERATDDMRKAMAYAAAARKKKLMMIACATVTIIILVVIVGKKFGFI